MGYEIFEKAELGRAYAIWMRVIAILGKAWIVAAIIHVWNVRSAKGISIIGLGISLTNVLNWFVYGAALNDMVLLISAIATMLLSMTLIVSVLYLNAHQSTIAKDKIEEERDEMADAHAAGKVEA